MANGVRVRTICPLRKLTSVVKLEWALKPIYLSKYAHLHTQPKIWCGPAVCMEEWKENCEQKSGKWIWLLVCVRVCCARHLYLCVDLRQFARAYFYFFNRHVKRMGDRWMLLAIVRVSLDEMAYRRRALRSHIQHMQIVYTCMKRAQPMKRIFNLKIFFFSVRTRFMKVLIIFVVTYFFFINWTFSDKWLLISNLSCRFLLSLIHLISWTFLSLFFSVAHHHHNLCLFSLELSKTLERLELFSECVMHKERETRKKK